MICMRGVKMKGAPFRQTCPGTSSYISPWRALPLAPGFTHAVFGDNREKRIKPTSNLANVHKITPLCVVRGGHGGKMNVTYNASNLQYA